MAPINSPRRCRKFWATDRNSSCRWSIDRPAQSLRSAAAMSTARLTSSKLACEKRLTTTPGRDGSADSCCTGDSAGKSPIINEICGALSSHLDCHRSKISSAQAAFSGMDQSVSGSLTSCDQCSAAAGCSQSLLRIDE